MNAVTPDSIRLACCNHKGGVGKTTCTVNLAAGLARMGWRVLVVDADPQAHLSASLGLVGAGSGGLAAVLCGRIPLKESLVRENGLTILSGSTALADVEAELSGQDASQTLLSQALVPMADSVDIIVIDCPPHLGPLTRQALAAATGVIVPMTPDFLAMQSLAWLMETLAHLAEAPNTTAPAVLGIVFNRFCAKKRLHREVQGIVRTHFPGVSFATVIRENVALAEAPSFGQDIFRYAPKSAGASDFSALCREMTRRLSPSVAGANRLLAP